MSTHKAVLASLLFLPILTSPLLAERQMENMLVVKPTGKSGYNGENQHGNKRVDFTRSGHELRVEDVELNATSDLSGTRIAGSFTVTHRFRFRQDGHTYVTVNAKAGRVELKVDTKEAGANPLSIVVSAAAAIIGADPETAVEIGKVSERVRTLLADDDARNEIATYIETVVADIAEASKKQLYIITTKTDDQKYAKTDDDIHLFLQDISGNSVRWNLDNKLKDNFEQGKEDRFVFFSDRKLSLPLNVKLEKDGHNGWLAKWIELDIPGSGKRFAIDGWLDNDEGNTPSRAFEFPKN